MPRFRRFIFLILLFSFTGLYGQFDRENHASYIGFYYDYGLSFNQEDKLFNTYVARKADVGISVTNPASDFLFYIGFGLKGWKVSANPPRLNGAFLEEVNQSYHPINGNMADSLTAVSVYQMTQGVKEYHQGGFYAYYIDAGIILTRFRFRPSISFHAGWEDYVLYTPMAHYYDQSDDSYTEFLTMRSDFTEVKVGFDVLQLFFDHSLPVSLDLNGGYKWMDYHGLKYQGTPLSVYTNEALPLKYRKGEKMTFGLQFRFWTNWGFL